MLNHINDIEYLDNKELGEGAYSMVYKVKHKKNNQLFALKYVILIRLIYLNLVKETAKI